MKTGWGGVSHAIAGPYSNVGILSRDSIQLPGGTSSMQRDNVHTVIAGGMVLKVIF